ncbi:hypothetical protein M3P21_17295 [Ruegeria sp. 2012CJ41-6]|uniref:Uncharacterized protein n=1 Tax=Ruegeria spongiae TaxID=2942209 RepID=A0ABT0Q7A9_9RHOB|nr:hypothetical protein [Ruegeria spongiae]MCL6285287.1 hypothetical protein [Ruegeria spongiae]
MTELILVDGHVHLYGSADRQRFFEAAWRNLSAAVPAVATYWQGCLLLTETARDSAFEALRSDAPPDGWKLRTIPQDPGALVLHRDGAALTVIAGRQVVTSEGIEILALPTTRRFEDGQPAAALLAELHDDAIPAVLPWGLGKWMGRRGRLVAELARSGPGVSLGDNAGRPPGWRVPLFGGAVVLPGTDPLPLPGAEDGVGRYGFTLPGRLDPDRPAIDMAQRLLALDTQPPVFGQRRTLGAVLSEQIALRRRKGDGAQAA